MYFTKSYLCNISLDVDCIGVGVLNWTLNFFVHWSDWSNVLSLIALYFFRLNILFCFRGSKTSIAA